MAVQFPQNPSEGDSFISPSGTIYVYQDSKWISATVNPNYADIQGATGPQGATGAIYWDRTDTTLSPSNTGDDVEITGVLTTTDQNIVSLWQPLLNKVAYEDYQGALYVSGAKSDWSFENNKVTQKTYSSNYLYIGNGYIVPSDYAETITWTTAIPGGAFSLRLQTSNDRINWSDVVTSTNGANTYTFVPGSQPVALRFYFQNSNGTTTNLVLTDVKFPNMRATQLVEQGSGGGGIVESSDWTDTTNGQHMYVRYADGTQICQYRNIGNLQTGTLQWIFPRPFIDYPGVTYGGCRTIATGVGEGVGVLVANQNVNVNESWVKVGYYKLSGYGDSYRYFGITAIGRWK